MTAEELLSSVKECKELYVESVTTDSHGADLAFRLKSEEVLLGNRLQILDIVDEALTVLLGGK